MMRLLAFGVICFFSVDLRAQISVVDSVGRTVVLPQVAKRIAPAGPPAEVLIYVVAPDLLAGWARHQSAETMAWLDPRSRALPILGHVTGWEGEPKYNNWRDAKVDMFVDYGSIGGRFEALANTVQSDNGIPYVLIDGSLEQTPAAFRMIGKLTGREQRAESLAQAAEVILAKTKGAAMGAKVYATREPDPRKAIISRSQHGEIFNYLGATNVALREVEISDEELKTWRPELIIAATSDVLPALQVQPWTQLPAVINKRIHVAPSAPWSWLGSPPSVNRLLGLVWLSQALVDKPDWNVAMSEAEELYTLMYQTTPPSDRLKRYFQHATE